MRIFAIASIAIFVIFGVNDPSTYAALENVEQKPEEKVYIPKDLDDCFIHLKKIVQPAYLEKMKNDPEKEMIQYHRGLGIWMRNNWGLWRSSRLKQYFNSLGIHHPDDMSGIILNSFWRHLHGQPIRLEEQIKSYQNYWKKEQANNK